MHVTCIIHVSIDICRWTVWLWTTRLVQLWGVCAGRGGYWCHPLRLYTQRFCAHDEN